MGLNSEYTCAGIQAVASLETHPGQFAWLICVSFLAAHWPTRNRGPAGEEMVTHAASASLPHPNILSAFPLLISDFSVAMDNFSPRHT